MKIVRAIDISAYIACIGLMLLAMIKGNEAIAALWFIASMLKQRDIPD